VRVAKSIVDYIFRWLATKFLSPEAQYHAGVNVRSAPPVAEQLDAGISGSRPASQNAGAGTGDRSAPFAIQNDQDAPPCSTCGAIMIRNGSCYKCVNCGATSGCA
jgi:ribonucleoside-diphosphate reductase alpha chain